MIARNTGRLIILTILMLALPTASADLALQSAVARIETAVDPISMGPGLSDELHARESWNSFEGEIARRLRLGSNGTGFFVNSEGYLITNAHVILSGVRYRGLNLTWGQWDSMKRLIEVIRDIWVIVGDEENERSYLAIPVAIAEDLDLAVLRVIQPPGESISFTALPLGDSDKLPIGTQIRALGYPENGYRETRGKILSLIHGGAVHERMQLVQRTDPETGEKTITVSGTRPGPVGRLQHDAHTGHGSSGGPLVDEEGRVVGITYALLTEQRSMTVEESSVEGIHLAIAANVLRDFLKKSGVNFREANP